MTDGIGNGFRAPKCMPVYSERAYLKLTHRVRDKYFVSMFAILYWMIQENSRCSRRPTLYASTSLHVVSALAKASPQSMRKLFHVIAKQHYRYPGIIEPNRSPAIDAPHRLGSEWSSAWKVVISSDASGARSLSSMGRQTMKIDAHAYFYVCNGSADVYKTAADVKGPGEEACTAAGRAEATWSG